MSSKFYNSVIEDEKKDFGIKDEMLLAAAKVVAQTYSKSALDKGSTFLDYNVPSYRCAYLYKYATLHTDLVTKYFRKLMRKKEVKSLLSKKKNIKICCLGGGPGTDIVGLFKALAVFPYFHQKIVEVTVLDICGGWRNSFKRIISHLTGGTVKNVPSTFVDSSFKAHLIAVDLLNNLPANVVDVISNADIICMVKFVSAVLGNPVSSTALKVIGEKLKPSVAVLFIDNFQGSVFQPVEDVFVNCGLQIALGPLHETFLCKKLVNETSQEKKEIFGRLPTIATKVSVIGFTKEPVVNQNSQSIENQMKESSLPILSLKPAEINCYSARNMSMENIFRNKCTQTEIECFNCTPEICRCDENDISSTDVEDLNLLMLSLNNLVQVLNQWEKQVLRRSPCCLVCGPHSVLT